MAGALAVKGRGAGAVLVLALCAGGAVWWSRSAERVPTPPVYTAEGLGGKTGAPATPSNRPPAPPTLGGDRFGGTGVQRAVAAYNAGDYKQAEQAARSVVERGRQSGEHASAAEREERARARWVLAFSAARRKDLREARERFEVLRAEASQLPDGGAGAEPTLEEEGAYQHAVLTAALGDTKVAEAEYVRFMRAYPESPLVHAAVKRIGRLHGGDLPKEAEAAWQQAMKAAREREKQRQRDRSLCGPEVLAELLRRRSGDDGPRTTDHRPIHDVVGRPHPLGGYPAVVSPRHPTPDTRDLLAAEMGTDERGTSLKALAEAARKRGFAAKGLRLTWKGLLQQKTPLVALIRPGHYVLVERVEGFTVRVWDPSEGRSAKDEGRTDHSGRSSVVGGRSSMARSYRKEEWERLWTGIALALR